MKPKNLLGELDIIPKIARAAEVGEDIDDVLLLAEEFLGQGFTSLLTELLSGWLDNLLTLLNNNIIRRSLALAANRLALRLALHRWRWFCGRTVVLVDSLHVIKEVVPTREAMARHSSLTVSEVAKMRPGSVTVHTVSLSLVAKKACSRGELNTDARLLVAAEWLQMRVDVLAIHILDHDRV